MFSSYVRQGLKICQTNSNGSAQQPCRCCFHKPSRTWCSQGYHERDSECRRYVNDADIVSPTSDDDQKAIKGWYFFDWANQAYALTVMTVIAPALMANLYNKATGTQSGDSFYATVLTISMFFVVFTAPALGVIADKMPIKKKLLQMVHSSGNYLLCSDGSRPVFALRRLHHSRHHVHNRYNWIFWRERHLLLLHALLGFKRGTR